MLFYGTLHTAYLHLTALLHRSLPQVVKLKVALNIWGSEADGTPERRPNHSERGEGHQGMKAVLREYHPKRDGPQSLQLISSRRDKKLSHTWDHLEEESAPMSPLNILEKLMKGKWSSMRKAGGLVSPENSTKHTSSILVENVMTWVCPLLLIRSTLTIIHITSLPTGSHSPSRLPKACKWLAYPGTGSQSHDGLILERTWTHPPLGGNEIEEEAVALAAAWRVWGLLWIF